VKYLSQESETENLNEKDNITVARRVERHSSIETVIVPWKKKVII